MADRNTGDLFIRVGMDLAEVDKGLIYLNKTVDENIKLTQERVKQNKISMEIDSSKIDSSVKDTLQSIKSAVGKSSGEILLKAGIDHSAVDKSIVDFRKTIGENVNSVQAKINQRNLKLDSDLSKIDTLGNPKATDQYFKEQYHGLKEIETLQKQIVALREAEYQAAAKAAGIDSKEAQKALKAKAAAEKEIATTQKKIANEILPFGYANPDKQKSLDDFHKSKSAQSQIYSDDTRKSNESWLSGDRVPKIQDTAALEKTTAHLKEQYHVLKSNEKLQQQMVVLQEAQYKNAVKESGVDSEKTQKALTAKNAVEKEIAATQKAIKETTEYLKIINKLGEAEKYHQDKSLREDIKHGRLATMASNRNYKPNQAQNKNISANAQSKIDEVTERFNIFGKLKDARDIGEGIISKTAELFGKIPPPVLKAGAAIGGFTAGLLAIPAAVGVASVAAKKIQDELLSLAETSIKAGDAFYIASRGAQMNIQEFAEFSRICKVTGINLADVTNLTNKLQTAVVKVESGMSGTAAASAKFLVNNLKKYGVELRKENGELKNAYEMSISLAEGLARAQEKGRGKEYLSILGATGDQATYLEDLAGNIELEKSIVKNKLADATLAHNTQGYWNALNLQKENLEGAFSSIFVPVAYDMIPKITEQLGRLTDVINNNAGGIRKIAEAAANAATKVTDLGVSLVEALGEGFNWATDKLDINDKAEKEFIENAKKIFGKKLGEVKTEDDLAKLFSSMNPKFEKEYQAYESGAAEKIRDEDLEAEKRKLADTIERLKKEAEAKLKDADTDKNYYEQVQRKKKIKEELKQDIEDVTRQSRLAEENIKKNFGHLKSEVLRFKYIAKNDLPTILKWQNSDDGKNFLQDKIETENSLTPAEQSARETRMGKLQEELQKLQLESRFGAQVYAKAVEELKIQREKMLKAAEALKQAHPKEYQEEVALIDKNYNAKLAKLKQQEQTEIKSIADETANLEFAATHSAFEKQLRDIELWKQAQLKKASTAEKVSAIIKNAALKETQAFENEMDRMKGKFQSLEEKIFELEHSQYENDIAKIFKEAQEMLDSGMGAGRVGRYVELAIAKINREVTPEKLKRPDYQLVNIPDFSEYEKLQSQIQLDLYNYKQNLKTPDLKISDEQFNLQEKLAAPVQIATDSINSLNLSIGNVGTSFNSVGYSADILADSFKNATTKIDELKINPPSKDLQLPNQTPNKNFTPNINLPPPNIADNDKAERIKAAAQKIEGKYQGKEFNNFQDLAKLTSQVAELTKIAGSIAQEFNQKQATPPNITVSPNINLSLNGSYILTQSMVNTMQNDITEEVANAIFSVVKQATDQIRI